MKTFGLIGERKTSEIPTNERVPGYPQGTHKDVQLTCPKLRGRYQQAAAAPNYQHVCSCFLGGSRTEKASGL